LCTEAKIFGGYIDFSGKEDQQALRDYLSKFRNEDKGLLVQFINTHPYFKRGGKRLAIKQQTCDLGRVMKEMGFPVDLINA
jgi:hypothetical protein